MTTTNEGGYVPPATAPPTVTLPPILDHVGVTGVDQLPDVGDDRTHRLRGERLVVGASELERVGVGDVERGHLGSELRARAPGAACRV